MTAIGVTVQTKEGPQFWDIDAGEVSVFKAPDGKKCVSILDVRINDPFPDGAVIKGLADHVDDAPISPDMLMKALDERFSIESESFTKEKVLKMSAQELQTILFDVVHNEIRELIRINNSLLCYMQNKYKFTDKYWIDCIEKGEEKK